MSILVELGLTRFIEKHGRIILNNVGILHAPTRLIYPEAYARRIVRLIHERMPITEEEKEQLWEECLEIWDPIVMCGDKIWAMMNNGVPEEMLAIVIK